MARTRVVSVIGYKNSGKTRVVESLVRELTGREFSVGTVKHTADDVRLDTPGKDTWRHREAGSRATAIIHDRSAAVFYDRYLTVREAVERLGGLDYVVIEGLKTLEITPKIVVPRSASDMESLSDGLEVAIARMPGVEIDGCDVPVISIGSPSPLADVVETRALPLLPGLDCGGCGHDDCGGMARAILAGEAEASDCVAMRPGFSLRVDGDEVALGPFVQTAFRNVVLGFVRSLKGVGEPSRVEFSFEVAEDG
jgi:molybdopterin-guanine dinucleotide biosynthesis protein B